jgi:hypothetical protein
MMGRYRCQRAVLRRGDAGKLAKFTRQMRLIAVASIRGQAGQGEFWLVLKRA